MSISDWISTVNIAITLLLGVGLWYVAQKASEIQSLRESLELKTDELVNAKFSMLAAELKTPIAILQTIVVDIKTRLEFGDEKFGHQGEVAHKLELKAAAAVAELRNYANEKFATIYDLNKLAENLRKMELALAHCESRCKANYTPGKN